MENRLRFSAMPMSAEARHDELTRWVAFLVGQPSATLKRRPGGGSHQAWDVMLDGEPRWFLRADAAEPDDTKYYTLRREAEVYSAITEIGLPGPRVLGIHDVLEAVLLERSPGEPGFAGLDPAVQTDIIDDFAPWLARMHAADITALTLPSLLPATTIAEAVRNELDLWERRLDESGAPDPILTACYQWLRDNVPDTGDTPPSLVQGDTGPGNFLHDGHRVTAVSRRWSAP
jgi:aminoglycoside phosphotransferase (APT) family kinase protein